MNLGEAWKKRRQQQSKRTTKMRLLLAVLLRHSVLLKLFHVFCHLRNSFRQLEDDNRTWERLEKETGSYSSRSKAKKKIKEVEGEEEFQTLLHLMKKKSKKCIPS